MVFNQINAKYSNLYSPILLCLLTNPLHTLVGGAFVFESLTCCLFVFESLTSSVFVFAPQTCIFHDSAPQIGQVVSEAAARQLKRVSMELGGKSPAIVFADADCEFSYLSLLLSFFFFALSLRLVPIPVDNFFSPHQ